MRLRTTILGVLIVLAGTAIAWWATWEPSLHTWEMVIRVNPARFSPAYIPGVWFDPNAGPARQESLVFASSNRVIEGAISDPGWLAAKTDSPRDVGRFRQRLRISAGKGAALLVVRFSDEDAEVARIGLEAFERSYRKCLGESTRRVQAKDGRDLRSRVREKLKTALLTNDDPEIRAAYEQMLKDDERMAAVGEGFSIVSMRLVTE